MGLKRAESQLQILLADTIWAMCKNTLSFNGGIRVEGLIGVTIDEEEIFLIPVNQKISKEVPHEVAIVEAEQSALPAEFKAKWKKDSQNDTGTSDSDNSSESSDSEGGNVSESEHEKARKKRSKRKRKRRRGPAIGDVTAEFLGVQSGAKIFQPLPREPINRTEVPESDEQISPPGKCGKMMVIKPEMGHEDSPEEDLVIVKSEFGSKKVQRPPVQQNTNRWPGLGGPSHQQVPPDMHQNPFQDNSFLTEVQGGHAAAILQHLSTIQNVASMQYSAQGQMAMCAQSPQHFVNPSRPHSFDGHSQPSSSQSPAAQSIGDHGDGFHLTRKRTSFSPRQINALEQAFSQNGHYMSAHERSVFAASIGLTEKVVTIWFQNRRQKLKRCEKQQPWNSP